MMIDRRLVQEVDWVLIGLVLVNSLIGVLFIYSSSHFVSGSYHLKQVFWIGAGLIALFLVVLVDYKFLVSFSPYFYLLTIAVLAGMPFLPGSSRGRKDGSPSASSDSNLPNWPRSS